MSTPAQIHEFSTGIHSERTADGGWVSRGFTGQYMNATIDPIPHRVQRSIANKKFAVAEGASTDEPAIIGRVISGDGDSDWSVIAFVTRGRDEKGRSASFYRYLLCEGANNLWKIISWIEYQQLHHGKLPVFNPFEDKVVGQPNIFIPPAPSPINLPDNLVLDSPEPLLLPPDSGYNFQLLNRLANQKTKINKQPIAWAYNVEALEQPRRFLVIQAASEEAYQLLERAIATTPQVVTAASIDEQAIKSAIKGLINVSVPKAEHIQTIVESLENSDITDSFWQSIFDGQGATNAIKQNIYSPQMVRLLALRAIVVPNTLPEYLNWLGKPNKQNDNLAVAEEFQAQFKTKVKTHNLNAHLGKGIKNLIILAYYKPEFVESIVWLLNTGIWSNIYQREVVGDIDHDLNLMADFAGGRQTEPFKLADNKQWDKLFKEIKDCWKIRPRAQDKYQPLADIFGELKSYKIAALFYQLGYGKVPKEIFSNIPKTRENFNVYGLKIEKEKTIPELVWLNINKVPSSRLRVYLDPLLLVILLVLVVIVYKVTQPDFLGKKPTTASPSPTVTPSISLSPTPTPAKQIPDKLLPAAEQNFSASMEAIDKLVDDLSKQDNIKAISKPEDIPENMVRQQIQNLLNISYSDYQEGLKYSKANKNVQKRIINAIYSYQLRYKNLEDTGYLIYKNQNNNFGGTVNQMKQDIENKLLPKK